MTVEVKIKVYAESARPFKEFEKVVDKHRANSFFYFLGVRFYIEKGDKVRAFLLLKSLDEHLPPLLQYDLRVSEVEVTSAIPASLKAEPGIYRGKKLGYPSADCIVDPEGRLTDGWPYIAAKGQNFSNVINLYKKVVAGKFLPSTRLA